MKKIFFLLLPLLFLSSSLVWTAPDIGIGSMTQSVAGGSGFDTSVTEYTLSETVGKIIKTVLSLVGVVFFVLVVYAGLLWMTAGGNDETVGKAVKIISMATIGFIITMAAYGITVFVLIATSYATSTSGSTVGGASSNPGLWQYFKDHWYTILF